MNRNARSAYTILKNRGVPVFEGCGGYGAHFIISAEYDCDDGLPAADYYQEYLREFEDENGKIQNAFGVRTFINDILEERGLFVEWINGGALGVYDS